MQQKEPIKLGQTRERTVRDFRRLANHFFDNKPAQQTETYHTHRGYLILTYKMPAKHDWRAKSFQYRAGDFKDASLKKTSGFIIGTGLETSKSNEWAVSLKNQKATDR